ncbi:TonB-dependent siderophore receptor [Advenella kashmirensis]|uniref:TonB-dependent siderophore receptor n=1 Tax=Advenella kashmirensis TaxID=310575 RepID=UPI0006869A7D|nr:TonB-dependent siderophore receptor [Advenella kashmirensis]
MVLRFTPLVQTLRLIKPVLSVRAVALSADPGILTRTTLSIMTVLACLVPLAASGALRIQAGPLGPALDSLASSTGISISYDGALVSGRTTRGLNGSYSTPGALVSLLHDTGLQAQRQADGAYVIRAISSPGSSVVTLSPVFATGFTESPTGLLTGYAARQSATATKTDTPLLETPQAISIIGRKQVQAQGAQTLVEAVKYTPGVQAGTNPVDNRFDSLRIRGFEPTLFLDGMQLPYGASLYGRPKVDPYMTERIEVLRGPSSSLYGSIAPGGLVNFVSTRPPEEPVRSVQLKANSWGRGEVAFDLGGPVNDDASVLYRVTGLGFAGGTQIDHADESRFMIAPSLTLRADPDTTLTLMAQYQRDNGGIQIQFLPAQGTLTHNPNGDIRYGKNVGEPDIDHYSRTQAWLGYEFEHRFSDAVTVRQKLRYAWLDTNLFAVAGAGLQPDLHTLNRQTLSAPERAQNVTMDNQLETKFQTGALKHTLLTGLDFRWGSSRIDLGFGSAPPIDLYDPQYGAEIVDPAVAVRTTQYQTQLGLYAQDQIAWNKWRLTLGARHDWVRTSTLNRIADTTSRQHEHAFSGRAGLNFVFDSGISPYVAWAHSFQPTIGTDVDGTPFKPTTGNQYEVGVKYQTDDGDLALNAALFSLEQKNSLTVDAEHPQFQTQSGRLRSRGLELEAIGRVTDNLNVSAAYTYTDARVTESNGTDEGKRVIVTPRHQASAWADYTFAGGALNKLTAGAGVRYFGKTYGNAANTVRIPSNTLVDVGLGYDMSAVNSRLKGLRVSLSVNNVFNRRYVATCTSLAACYLGSGRVAMATLRYDW